MVTRQILPFVAILRPLYEFIYPPTCLACENHLNEVERKICFRCWSSIRKLTTDDGLYHDKLSALTSHGNIAGLASAFHFEKDGILQTLVHHLKYDDLPSIGIELGKLAGAAIPAMIGDVSCAELVPVPLHPAKERERGYNQSEFVCGGISEVTGLKTLSHLLKRTRHTQTQTQLNAHERKKNVAGAFAIRSRYTPVAAGSTFLLVDDIITTGATIEECAKVLKDAGAERVFATSVAVADPGHVP